VTEHVSQSTQEIIARAEARRVQRTGVYFLISAGRIIYIGQARCVDERIVQHSESTVPFDSWSFIECEMHQLDELEGHYVQKIKPELNGRRSHKCRTVITPNGVFTSLRAAAVAHGIQRNAAHSRIMKNKYGWSYGDSPPEEFTFQTRVQTQTHYNYLILGKRRP
jgi:hypothetical protein